MGESADTLADKNKRKPAKTIEMAADFLSSFLETSTGKAGHFFANRLYLRLYDFQTKTVNGVLHLLQL